MAKPVARHAVVLKSAWGIDPGIDFLVLIMDGVLELIVLKISVLIQTPSNQYQILILKGCNQSPMLISQQQNPISLSRQLKLVLWKMSMCIHPSVRCSNILCQWVADHMHDARHGLAFMNKDISIEMHNIFTTC